MRPDLYLETVTRIHLFRIFMAVGALFSGLAAISGFKAQSLRWPDVDPATTNKVLWYSESIVLVAIGLVATFSAIRPGKASAMVLISTAAVLWLGGMAAIPRNFNLPFSAIGIFMAGIGLWRITAEEQSAGTRGHQ